MLVHGIWDTSAFLPQPTGSLANVSRASMVVEVVGAIVAIIIIVRRDRSVTVTPEGLQQP
jgi:hypothetical protein